LNFIKFYQIPLNFIKFYHIPGCLLINHDNGGSTDAKAGDKFLLNNVPSHLGIVPNVYSSASVSSKRLWPFHYCGGSTSRGWAWREASLRISSGATFAVADTRFPVPYYPTGAMFIAISTFMADGPWILFTAMYRMAGIERLVPLSQQPKTMLSARPQTF